MTYALIFLFGMLATADAVRAQEPVPVMEFHGLIHVWVAADDSLSTFRIRRTELKVTGPIAGALRWTIQIDPSKVVTLRQERDADDDVRDVSVDLGSVLQDAILTYRLQPGLFVDVGQYKMPLGLEGTQSSATLETIERGLLASARGKLADVRGIGAQARISFRERVQINAGIFHDVTEHLNRLDTNADKAVVGRVSARVTPALSVGATTARVLGSQSDEDNGDRLGAHVLVHTPRATLKTEFLAGTDGAIDRRGFYALAAYRPHPKVEAVVRYDEWDPDLAQDSSPATARERDYVAGLTYLLSGQAAKVQLNYVHKTFDEAIAEPRDQIILNMQAAW